MKILIADDHTIVREGLKKIVQGFHDLESVDEASDGIEAERKIISGNYDIVIMDISMPHKSGLDVLKAANNRKKNTKTLILSVHKEEMFAARAIKSGAYGYITKDSAFDELEKAIDSVKNGKKYISPEVSTVLADKFYDHDTIAPHEKLSGREFHVLCLIAAGKTVKEISEELYLSDKTISTYRKRILDKMMLKNNAELTTYAVKNKLVEM
ncbi:MAG: response regulator transcription factor [Melioribacteraceae bacterium]|nr:response regulator transcription factor [Melioribacteraceae bacterium]